VHTTQEYKKINIVIVLNSHIFSSFSFLFSLFLKHTQKANHKLSSLSLFVEKCFKSDGGKEISFE